MAALHPVRLFLLLSQFDDELESLVPRILEEDRIVGAVVLVGTREAVTYRKAFGLADVNTIFDLASVTKVVGTTTAVMRLVEAGRMRLDEPIGNHLAAFRERDFTVRELLTHTSGLPAYLGDPKVKTPDGIVREIAGLPQDEKKYRYS